MLLYYIDCSFLDINHVKAAGEEKIYELLQELLWNHPSQVFILLIVKLQSTEKTFIESKFHLLREKVLKVFLRE